MLEAINDAARILADVHHEQSVARQHLISFSLDKSVKDLLPETKLDGWLFGANLLDRVKNAKALIKSSFELKNELQETTDLVTGSSALPEIRASVQQDRHSETPLSADHEVRLHAGRLSLFYKAWTLITSDPRVLSWVKGYRLPITRTITQDRLPPSRVWSPDEKKLIQDEINRLLSIGAITISNPCENQFITSIFLIQKRVYPSHRKYLRFSFENLPL